MMTVMNGQARDAGLPPAARPMPQFAVPVHQAGPASSRAPQEKKSSPSRTVHGDAVIRVLAAVVVVAVAAFAAVVSYSHIFDLGVHHGQSGTAARLLPLSVDGLIAAASLVMLHAARNQLPVPWLARICLAGGVGATVAANVAYGLPFGWLAAVVSAWPAVAFVGSVEMAVRFVRDARHFTAGGDRTSDSDRSTDHDSDKGHRRPDSEAGTGKPQPGRQRQRPKPPSANDRVRDILRRDPGLPKADVAKRAGVSVRTVERVMGDTGSAA
jgi:hypothetical protein